MKRYFLLIGILILICIGLTLAWHFTELKEWINFRTVADWVVAFSDHPFAPLFLIGAYVLGALILFPHHLFTLAAGIAFGPFLGFIYAMLGNVVAAIVTLWAGRLVKQTAVNKIAGKRLDNIMEPLQRKGLIAILFLRVVPIAPFTLENLVAGAAGARTRDMALGTFLGMAPGTALSVTFGSQFKRLLGQNGEVNILLIIAFVIVAIVAFIVLKRWVKKHDGGSEVDQEHKTAREKTKTKVSKSKVSA